MPARIGEGSAKLKPTLRGFKVGGERERGNLLVGGENAGSAEAAVEVGFVGGSGEAEISIEASLVGGVEGDGDERAQAG